LEVCDLINDTLCCLELMERWAMMFLLTMKRPWLCSESGDL
jgi:hypothetical protein